MNRNDNKRCVADLPAESGRWGRHTHSPCSRCSSAPKLGPPPYRQEGQAPQLPDIALRRAQRAQRLHLKSIRRIVLPAPHFTTQLLGIGINQVPEMVVSRHDFVVQRRVVAEIYIQKQDY